MTTIVNPSSEVKVNVGDKEEDYIEIKPLGGGHEVGRSCIIVRFKGKTIMLDCGLHPGESGISALPYFDEVDLDTIDLLLVSHFHIDHAAGLPFLLEKTKFKAKCYMTHPTKSIYKLLLQDYVKVSTLSVDETLYEEKDILESMTKIDTINFHEVAHHKGIKFWCYNAGHVLGAAMFMIEIAGVKILYTGDYSRREDRHLNSAELPEIKPDVLIIESTHGNVTLNPITSREHEFTHLVSQICARGGRCLVPVFAMGRAQELLLILDEFWEQNPSLAEVPIYYAGALARKCTKVYQTYTNHMNKRMRAKAEHSNPFNFRHVTHLLDISRFDHSKPCVVLASPGMLQNGMSRNLFEMWCEDRKSGCIIAGYCVEGTLAKEIMTEPETVASLNGLSLRLNMSVHSISFSAHADYTETRDFIAGLTPNHVVLVHGEENMMASMQRALQRQFPDGQIKVSSPQNGQSVEVEVRAQKTARVIGDLAAEGQPKEKDRISGLLVRKDFNYQMLSTSDLPKYTFLASSIVTQRLTVPYNQSFETLCFFLSQAFDIKLQEPKAEGAASTEPADTGVGEGQTKDETKAKSDAEEGKQALGSPIMIYGVVTATVFQTSKTREYEAAAEQAAKKKETRKRGFGEAARSKKRTKTGGGGDTGDATEPVSADPKKEAADTSDDDQLVLPRVEPTKRADFILLEWQSNPANDMIADSIVSLVMSAQVSPAAAKLAGSTPCSHSHSPAVSPEQLLQMGNMLRQHFKQVDIDEAKCCITVSEKAERAVVDVEALRVEAEDPSLQTRVQSLVDNIACSLFPLRA